MYLKVLWARKLGVAVDDVVGQIWADLCHFEDVPKGYVLVAWDEHSPAYAMHDQLKAKRIKVITRKEEQQSGKKSGFYFEVFGQPYCTHPWGTSQAVTQKFRSLAVLAQKQAKAAGAIGSFGNAYRMKDFIGILSSKTARRTFVTQGAKGGISSMRLMRRTGHDDVNMLMRYFDGDDDVLKQNGHNFTDVIVRGAKDDDSQNDGLTALVAQQMKTIVQLDAEIERLRGLLEVHKIPFDCNDSAAVKKLLLQGSVGSVLGSTVGDVQARAGGLWLANGCVGLRCWLKAPVGSARAHVQATSQLGDFDGNAAMATVGGDAVLGSMTGAAQVRAEGC